MSNLNIESKQARIDNSLYSTPLCVLCAKSSVYVRTFGLELLAVLLLLIVAGAALFARQNLPPHTVDLTVKWPDTRLHLAGFYDREENAEFHYRWSEAYAFVQLPFATHAAPVYLASVRMRTANPDWHQPVTFLANEQAFATVSPDTSFRVYRFILPANADADGTVRLALETRPFSPPGDRRELGVVLTDMTLQGLPYRDWSVVLLLSLALPGLWLWLRWQRTSPGATMLICAGLALALLAAYALYRPAPLRYTWLLLLVLLGSASVMLLARSTASRLVLVLLVVLVSFSGVFWPSWLSDDAFISFRYAQNLVAGHGLVYNVGERVEGYTNFLWTMLAALVLALGGDLLFWTYVAGIVLALAILLCTYWLGRRWLGPVWALVATLLVATSQSLLIYTARGSGLETGLFTLLALVSSAVYLRAGTQPVGTQPVGTQPVGTQPVWAQHAASLRSSIVHCPWSIFTGLAFALTTLTRPEGALLMGLTLVHLLLVSVQPDSIGGNARPLRVRSLSAVRRLFPVGLAYLAIVLPYFLWRVAYYGDFLPNTFYAKTGGGIQQMLRGLEYAGTFALAMGGPLLLLLAVPLVLRRWAILHTWQGYLLLLVSGYSAYIILVGGDHFPGERFFVPLVPWVALLLAGGMADLYGMVAHRTPGRWLATLALALLLLFYAPYALLRTAPVDSVLAGNDESVWIWRELGWWLHDHAAPDASVAALGAGAVAYYGQRTTIDLLGLTDRHIAHTPVTQMGSGVAGHEKQDVAYVLNERRPTYIPRIWDGYFGGEQVLREQYRLVQVRSRSGRQLELWQRLP